MPYLKLDPGQSGIYRVVSGPEPVDSRFGPKNRWVLTDSNGDEVVLEASNSLSQRLARFNGQAFTLLKDKSGKYQVQPAGSSPAPAPRSNGKPDVPLSQVLEKLDKAAVRWFGLDLKALADRPQTIASSLLTSIFIQWGSIYRIVPDADEAEPKATGKPNGNGADRVSNGVISEIFTSAKRNGYSQRQVLDRCRQLYGCAVSELTKEQAEQVLAKLKENGHGKDK